MSKKSLAYKISQCFDLTYDRGEKLSAATLLCNKLYTFYVLHSINVY